MKTIKISDVEYEKIKALLPEVKEIEDMADLVGQRLSFWCARYIYHGTVKKVTSDFVILEDAQVVFDTGSYDSKEPATAEKLPNNAYIMRGAIECITGLNYK